MQLNGSFTPTLDKHAIVVKSQYDTFSKDATITVPDGWSAVFYQNGKHACNGTDTFTIRSRKSSGLKLPLFGAVKADLYFVRRAVEYLFKRDNVKSTTRGKNFTFSAYYSYKITLESVSKLFDFLKDLKVKPASDGTMFTFDDVNYIMETVWPNFITIGSGGTATSRPSPSEKAYRDNIENAFKYKLCKPFGYGGSSLSFNYFKAF